MEIRQNMAAVMRILREESGKSMMEFSEELEISRSALQDYMTGNGNPNLATIEHLANRLGVSSSVLIGGSFTDAQLHVLQRMLEQLKMVDRLTPEKRHRIAELVQEMLSLCAEGENGG